MVKRVISERRGEEVKLEDNRNSQVITIGRNLIALQILTMMLVGFFCFLGIFQIKKYILMEKTLISFAPEIVELNKTKTTVDLKHKKIPNIPFIEKIDWRTSSGLGYLIDDDGEIKIWLENAVIKQSTIPMEFELTASIKNKVIGVLPVKFSPYHLPVSFNSEPNKITFTTKKSKGNFKIRMIPADSLMSDLKWSWDEPLKVNIKKNELDVQIDPKKIPFGETELTVRGSYDNKILGQISVLLKKTRVLRKISFYPDSVDLNPLQLRTAVRWETDPSELPDDVISAIRYSIQPPSEEKRLRLNELGKNRISISISENDLIVGEVSSVSVQAILGKKMVGHFGIKIYGPKVPAPISNDPVSRSTGFGYSKKHEPVPASAKASSTYTRGIADIDNKHRKLRPTPSPSPVRSYNKKKYEKYVKPSVTPVRIRPSPSPSVTPVRIKPSPTPYINPYPTVTPTPRKENDSEEEERRKKLWQRAGGF